MRIECHTVGKQAEREYVINATFSPLSISFRISCKLQRTDLLLYLCQNTESKALGLGGVSIHQFGDGPFLCFGQREGWEECGMEVGQRESTLGHIVGSAGYLD